MNGNRAGMTVFIQISIPSLAPDREVLLSKISSKKQNPAIIPIAVCLLLTGITSKESMQDIKAPFIEFKKEVPILWI